jgi:hypothetical protein
MTKGPAFTMASRYHGAMHAGIRIAVSALFCVGLVVPANADDKKTDDKKAAPTKPATATAGKNVKPKVFDFTGLDIAGRLRAPQLLYFLERANEELDRASLEKRSFVPNMIRSIDDEAL